MCWTQCKSTKCIRFICTQFGKSGQKSIQASLPLKGFVTKRTTVWIGYCWGSHASLSTKTGNCFREEIWGGVTKPTWGSRVGVGLTGKVYSAQFEFLRTLISRKIYVLLGNVRSNEINQVLKDHRAKFGRPPILPPPPGALFRVTRQLPVLTKCGFRKGEQCWRSFFCAWWAAATRMKMTGA